MIGYFKSGDVLNCEELAQSMNTSEATMREAAQRMIDDGALQIDADGIINVPRLSKREFEELTEIRKKLQGLAAAMAARRMSRSEIDRLDQFLSPTSDESRTRKSVEATQRVSLQLLATLCDGAGCGHLKRLIEDVWVKLGPAHARFLTRMEAEYTVPAFSEMYAEMVVWIRRGNPVKAQQAVADAVDARSQAYLRFGDFAE